MTYRMGFFFGARDCSVKRPVVFHRFLYRQINQPLRISISVNKNNRFIYLSFSCHRTGSKNYYHANSNQETRSIYRLAGSISTTRGEFYQLYLAVSKILNYLYKILK